jgi:GNAT superfamily N-acetyltransferase
MSPLNPPIRVRELGDGDVELLERLYSEVLVPAFDPDELDEPWWRDGEPADGRLRTLTIVALDAGAQVVGGVVGEWYRDARVLLIAYVAVRDDARGRGIGTALMNAAADRWHRRLEPRLVLGELEDPRHHSGGREDPALRLRFYDRLGVKALAVPYFQPRLRPTDDRVYHLLLGVFAASPEVCTPDGGVDAPALTAFLDEYVTACEGAEALSGDPEIRWLRRFYTEKPRIPLLPLDRYEEVPDPEPPERSGEP